MRPALSVSVRRHALAWLVAANAVGLLLATLLLWPDLNDVLAPLTYGRWAPVHLDGQLYGWCALPLVGVLFAFFLRDEAGVRPGRLGLWCWTLGLAYGAATWLAGGASGKLFLDFAGPARIEWSLALVGLWVLLAWRWARTTPAAGERGPGWLLLAFLLTVPAVLFWVTSPGVYPPVNPDSGGATGASLLGSTLVLLVIFGLLPRLLRLRPRDRDPVYWPAMAVSAAFYAGMNHTAASHHEIGQIVGLGLLLAWIPLVVRQARAFAWPAAATPWLAAAWFWWLVVVADGLVTFLPGVSERLKFTNALVAHSHLAMAGLATSLNAAILLALPGRWAPSRASFWSWQVACAVHCGVLLWLGWREGAEPELLWARGGVADWCYGLRLAAGAVMFAASVAWLRAAWTHDEK